MKSGLQAVGTGFIGLVVFFGIVLVGRRCQGLSQGWGCFDGIGLGLIMLVVIQNSYAAAVITVEAGQKVISTGLYGFVRHPMYMGVLITWIGIPLALDCWWGLVILVPSGIAFALRILDEEKMLKQELDGYSGYMQEVRYRLVPYVW